MKKLFMFTCLFCLAINSIAVRAANKTAGVIDSSKYLRLQLFKDIINKDDALIFFKNNSTSAYEPGNDAIYFQGNGQVSFSSYSSDNIPLAINIQPLPKKSTAINLNVFVKTDGTYQLKLTELNNIPLLFDIWLMDNYQKDSLDIRNNPSYSFNVSVKDTNTFGAKRFSIIIRQNVGRAYHLLSFAANKAVDAKQVQVIWTTENEQDYTNYTVERSTDNGKTYVALGNLLSTGVGSYNINDKAPAMGLNFYRLKQTDINNTVSYSPVVQVPLAPTNKTAVVVNTPSIYPNPVADVVNIVMNDKAGVAAYNISITDISGFQVRKTTITNARWQNQVGDLKPGIYLVKVTDNKDKIVVGFSKFIKN